MVVMERFESLVERKIREAQERGEFDNLAGAGRPLPGANEPYDPEWWVKSLLRREGETYPLPGPLALRKEIAELTERISRQRSESAVREIVADLNERIRGVRRGPVEGGVVLRTVDVEEAVRMWRESRVNRA